MFLIAFILGALAVDYLQALPYWMCQVDPQKVEWLTLSEFKERHYSVILQFILFLILVILTVFCLFAWFCVFHLAWSFEKCRFMAVANGFFFPVIMSGGCGIVTAMFEIFAGVTFASARRTRTKSTCCSRPPHVISVGQARTLLWMTIIVGYWALDHTVRYFVQA